VHRSCYIDFLYKAQAEAVHSARRSPLKIAMYSLTLNRGFELNRVSRQLLRGYAVDTRFGASASRAKPISPNTAEAMSRPSRSFGRWIAITVMTAA
jgi:hypothetical protein